MALRRWRRRDCSLCRQFESGAVPRRIDSPSNTKLLAARRFLTDTDHSHFPVGSVRFAGGGLVGPPRLAATLLARQRWFLQAALLGFKSHPKRRRGNTTLGRKIALCRGAGL